MKIETKEIYKCEYCNKLYQIKRFAIEHEKICKENPNNYRACFHCEHLAKQNFEQHYDTFQGEDSRILSLFYCEKIKSFLYPPKSEILKKGFDLGNETNKPMLKKCEHKTGY